MPNRNENLLTVRLPKELMECITQLVTDTGKNKNELAIELFRRALDKPPVQTITLNADEYFAFKTSCEAQFKRLDAMYTSIILNGKHVGTQDSTQCVVEGTQHSTQECKPDILESVPNSLPESTQCVVEGTQECLPDNTLDSTQPSLPESTQAVLTFDDSITKIIELNHRGFKQADIMRFLNDNNYPKKNSGLWSRSDMSKAIKTIS